MLSAYFDESQRDGGLFCVAGFAFAPAQVKKFNREWRRLMGPRAPFHMVDLVAQRGAFRNVPRDECDDVLRMAISIINGRMTHGVAVSCYVDEVRRLAPRWILGFSSEYAVCCHLAMFLLSKHLRQARLPDRVALHFEAGHAGQGEADGFLTWILKATALHPEMKDYYRHDSHAFVRKADAPALQAADLLAWEWAKYRDETVDQQRRRLRLSLRALLAGRAECYSTRHLTGQPLGRYLRQVTEMG